METSEKYLLSLQKLSLNEIIKLFLNIEGVKKVDKGDFDNALDCFSRAIDLPPKDSVSYFNRASLRMYLGDLKGASSDLKAAERSGLARVLSWVYHIIFYVLVFLLFYNK